MHVCTIVYVLMSGKVISSLVRVISKAGLGWVNPIVEANYSANKVSKPVLFRQSKTFSNT